MTTGDSSSQARRYERRLLVVLFLGVGFVLFDRQALAFLAPYINADFGLSSTQLGLAAGALSLTWAVSGIVMGMLSDRLGRRKSLLITAVVLFSLISAVSGLASGFVALLIARALMGAAEGGVIPLSQSLMFQASRPKRRGLNTGLIGGASAGLLGGIAAPFAFIWLAESIGWRWSFFVTLLPGLVIAAAMAMIVRERPFPTTAEPEKKPAAVKVPLRQILGTRNVVLCILIAVCYLTWFSAIVTFTPLYLLKVKGFSPGTMGTVMTCLGVAWMVWGVVTPAISDRIGRKPALAGFTVLAVCCPLAVMFVDNAWLLGAVMMLTYTGVGCFTLFMAVIPGESVPPGALATVVGVTMGAGELLGGALGPVLAGWASDRWGLQAAMVIAAVSAAIVVLLSLGLRETAPRILSRSTGNRPAARAGTAEEVSGIG
ncbi:MFS transporter [Amycolatopsis sp. NPDC052450]|uniref:MFS transporter n=1 Tax=Amycolatopsis sp. NPDC052450 TaxID=3363937 RepID=UPI0037C9DD7F